MTGKHRNDLHDEEKKRDHDTQAGDNTHAEASLDHPERNARRQPAERGSHGADFRHGHEEGVTEKKAGDSRHSDGKDSDGRRLKSLVYAAERRRNGFAAAVGEEQTAGCDKIAVEALEKSKESHEQNQLYGPVSSKGVLEGDGSGKALAQ